MFNISTGKRGLALVTVPLGLDLLLVDDGSGGGNGDDDEGNGGDDDDSSGGGRGEIVQVQRWSRIFAFTTYHCHFITFTIYTLCIV